MRKGTKMINNMLGYPIYIATRSRQKRTHHKKRINKKWAKRYGFVEYNFMPHDQIMEMNGCLYMTKQTFEKLKKGVLNERFNKSRSN